MHHFRAGGTVLAHWKRHKRIWISATIAGGFVLLLVLALGVIYPSIARHAIRTKLTDRLAKKLDREVKVGAIDVSIGHATIRDIEIRGPADGETPLVHIDRVDLDFAGARSLVGSLQIDEAAVDGVLVTIRRDASGKDNVHDILDRLRGNGDSGGGSSARLIPGLVTLSHVRLVADDARSGLTVLVGDGDATWKPGELVAQVRNITATSASAPAAWGEAAASIGKLDIRKATGKPPVMAVSAGELALWPKLSLSGIGGSITPDSSGRYVIDLAGGYGRVPGNLWTAKGTYDPVKLLALIDLEAAKFQLERLAPILERTPIVDYKSTSVDTKLHLEFDPNGAKFAGNFHLVGLNVGHPLIADKEVHDLSLSGDVAGSFDRPAGKLELTRGDFVARDVPFSVTGAIVRPQHVPETLPGKNGKAVPVIRGPYGVMQVSGRLVIPPIDCQRMLNALPKEMTPYLEGYKLKGVFDTDIDLAIDWTDLDATQLDGHVGINHCKVLDEPADGPKRLLKEFEHYVEVEKGQWISFVVGPANDDFVPINEISPFLIKSITTTEDSGFYHHHGFIPSEFRSALVTNLKAEKFAYGASSITMQLVKNVLLYREKTLARKLQELFLTWHVENTLDKDRILEIYFNVIEYGPNLYGIGPAAEHFFGKVPKNLNAVEAAFFSTILPNPKARYAQYCNGTLNKWTADKIARILNIELKRDRLTQQEYDEAMLTPLLFTKDGTETEEQCLKRMQKVIKNARSTNPQAKH